MRALNDPSVYRDATVFEAEQGQLFARTWLFAGLLNEIGSEGSYLRIRLAGRDLLLRNHEGNIRAFANVCSHRHAQLCSIRQGRGALRCPYHGWVYNAEGIPVGMPFKEQFPEVLANPSAFRQPEYDVGIAGAFVFVRFQTGSLSLKEHLGDLAFAFLSRVSVSSGPALDSFERSVPANWKTVVENALEGYHVPIVHPRTLGAADGMATGYDAVVENFDSPRHSYMTKLAEPDWLQKWQRKAKQIGKWPFRFDHYIHYLIFPNLTVTSFLGYSFHVQRFDPLALDSTSVESRILASTFDGQTEVGRRMMEHIYREGIDFTHRVFDEDAAICAAVNTGLRQASAKAILAKEYELRVLHFQRAYQGSMAPPIQ